MSHAQVRASARSIRPFRWLLRRYEHPGRPDIRTKVIIERRQIEEFGGKIAQSNPGFLANGNDLADDRATQFNKEPLASPNALYYFRGSARKIRLGQSLCYHLRHPFNVAMRRSTAFRHGQLVRGWNHSVSKGES